MIPQCKIEVTKISQLPAVNIFTEEELTSDMNVVNYTGPG